MTFKKIKSACVSSTECIISHFPINCNPLSQFFESQFIMFYYDASILITCSKNKPFISNLTNTFPRIVLWMILSPILILIKSKATSSQTKSPNLSDSKKLVRDYVAPLSTRHRRISSYGIPLHLLPIK